MAFPVLAISDRRSLRGETLTDWLRRMAALAIPAVQLREKDLGDRELYDLAVSARRILPSETRLLINSRVDVAIAAGADGVHLPVAGVPPALLRKRYGEELLLGCSTHTLAEVDRAVAAGASYLTFGPVYPTPSKASFGSPVGLAQLAQAAARGLPVLALGGVEPARFSEVAVAGASGVAGIRLFQRVSSALPEILQAARDSFPIRDSRSEVVTAQTTASTTEPCR